MEKETLLGSLSPEVSSPSLSAEMANFGSKAGRGTWLVLSVSVEWDTEGLDKRTTSPYELIKQRWRRLFTGILQASQTQI